MGSSWASNGFAFSPAADAVYLTTIGQNTLHIERVDVATGHRVVVAELLNSSIAWTRDGATLAVLAAHVAVAYAGSTRTATRDPALSLRSCSARGQKLCLVAIHVPRSGALAARAVTVRVPTRGVFEVTCDARDRRSVDLIGAVGFGSVLYRIDLGTRFGRTTQLASLARGLVVAAASTQPQILYLQGSPPALWRADLASGRITRRHELIPNAWLEAGSW